MILKRLHNKIWLFKHFEWSALFYDYKYWSETLHGSRKEALAVPMTECSNNINVLSPYKWAFVFNSLSNIKTTKMEHKNIMIKL